MSNDDSKTAPKRGLWMNSHRMSVSPANNILDKQDKPPDQPSSPTNPSSINDTPSETRTPTGGHFGPSGWSASNIALSARRSSSSPGINPILVRNSSFTSRSSISAGSGPNVQGVVPPTSSVTGSGTASVSGLGNGSGTVSSANSEPSHQPTTLTQSSSLSDLNAAAAVADKSIMMTIEVPSINANRKMKHSLSTKVEQVIVQLVKRNPELKGDVILQDPRTGVFFDEKRTLASYLLKEGCKLEGKVRPSTTELSLTLKIRVENEEKPYTIKYNTESKLRGLIQLLPDQFKFTDYDTLKYTYKGQHLLPETPLSELCFSEDDLIEISLDNSPQPPVFSYISQNRPASEGPLPETKSFTPKNLGFKNRQSVYAPKSLSLNGSIILKIQFETNPNRPPDAHAEFVNRVMSLDLNKTVEEVLPEVLRRFPVDSQKNYMLYIPKATGRDRVVLKPTEKIGVYNINNNDQLNLKETKKPKKELKEKTAVEKKEKKAGKKKEKVKVKKEKKTILGRINPMSKSPAKPTDATSSQTPSEAELDPETINKVLEYLEKNSLELEGIFRLSASAAQTKDFARAIFSREVHFDDLESPHVAACGLKQYFREIPQPLFPTNTYSKYIAVGKLDSDERVNGLKDLIQQLPEVNKAVLFSLVKLLTRVSEKSDVNFMIPGNLGVVFGPTLLRSSPDTSNLDAMFESEYQIKVIETLVTDYLTIFSEMIEEEESGEESEEEEEEEGEDGEDSSKLSPLLKTTGQLQLPSGSLLAHEQEASDEEEEEEEPDEESSLASHVLLSRPPSHAPPPLPPSRPPPPPPSTLHHEISEESQQDLQEISITSPQDQNPDKPPTAPLDLPTPTSPEEAGANIPTEESSQPKEEETALLEEAPVSQPPVQEEDSSIYQEPSNPSPPEVLETPVPETEETPQPIEEALPEQEVLPSQTLPKDIQTENQPNLEIEHVPILQSQEEAEVQTDQSSEVQHEVQPLNETKKEIQAKVDDQTQPEPILELELEPEPEHIPNPVAILEEPQQTFIQPQPEPVLVELEAEPEAVKIQEQVQIQEPLQEPELKPLSLVHPEVANPSLQESLYELENVKTQELVRDQAQPPIQQKQDQTSSIPEMDTVESSQPLPEISERSFPPEPQTKVEVSNPVQTPNQVPIEEKKPEIEKTSQVAADKPVSVAKSAQVNAFLKSQQNKAVVVDDEDDDDDDDDDYDVEDDEDDGLKNFEDDDDPSVLNPQNDKDEDGEPSEIDDE